MTSSNVKSASKMSQIERKPLIKRNKGLKSGHKNSQNTTQNVAETKKQIDTHGKSQTPVENKNVSNVNRLKAQHDTGTLKTFKEENNCATKKNTDVITKAENPKLHTRKPNYSKSSNTATSSTNKTMVGLKTKSEDTMKTQNRNSLRHQLESNKIKQHAAQPKHDDDRYMKSKLPPLEPPQRKPAQDQVPKLARSLNAKQRLVQQNLYLLFDTYE
jgi:hypothetical protein